MGRWIAIAAVIATLLPTARAGQDGIFSGDVRLACEAILCLSSSAQPSQCSASLQRYFSIKLKFYSDTIKARANFLALCPAASMNSSMKALVEAIANGAGRCDAASLNATLLTYAGEGQSYVGDVLPSYCAAYTGNPYTNLGASLPVYVGTPDRYGHWVDASHYAQELASYNARIAAENAAAQGRSDGMN
ncbi:conjugal transfer protein TrbM [Caenimonas koreensis DSM 17982]|uniref:Conjugal transfer protein TrbM n=1 Tax=Caenimonas koreensis DSM 17982 TaxID=1121255 RepID=A0A844BFZ3_9BURK|nr:TrbM/KikA/MpfK family conjugal transfer protein [Caenimonas koreensis]MRD49381.1 conjugal transfer protein TrbM [Caenimonas koreensis DSM 17982]